MAKKIGRIILIFILIVIFIAGVATLASPSLTRRAAQKSFPVVDGEIQVDGLSNKVDIYRDDFGIPHIYGDSHHDLFFAQGYVHAQDRFWQMDFWRHTGAGRLSELIGKPMIETDKFLRTLGWERVAKEELALLGPEEIAILEAYSNGVNAYLSVVTGTNLSLEYTFLPLLNRNYQPKSWEPLNSLTWGKAMAWDLRDNLDSEIDRAILLKDLPEDQVDFIFPLYPEDHPLIIPDFQLKLSASNAPGNYPAAENGVYSINFQNTMLNSIQSSITDLDTITRGGFEGLGSNSWVIGGKLTDSGKPYLVNDPHLGSQMPSIWYEIGLHCRTKNENCQLDVTGFSFAGVPGVIIGHNDRIAWGLTNTGPDVMDLYIEKINPDNPTQYEFRGEWKEMEVVTEIIQIAGQEPLEHNVYLTQHGPIIGTEYGLDDFDQTAGISVPEHYALALRWTALEPSCVFCAIWDINLAQNWQDFSKASQKFVVPSQNLLFADVEGNIAYQMPGWIPIRDEGHDGSLPVPGWTGEYEWQGYIPFEELPNTLNPAEGYIVTANNAVVGTDYPYIITMEWNRGFRAQRIVDMIKTAPTPIVLDYMKEMQGDNYDVLAEDLVPVILNLQFSDPELDNAQQLLAEWDYQADMESAAAALYMAFWQNLITNAVQDDLPETYHIGVGSSAKEIIRQLTAQPKDPWWDDPTTSQKETRDEIFRLTLEESYHELQKDLGKDPTDWKWGDLHTITFHNQVMTSFPIINSSFDRGPYSVSGGNEIVNAAGWDPELPYLVDWLPSMRMIVDLSDLSNSLSVHTTGQSGHAYHPNYIDMADIWRKIQYHPMLWQTDTIEQQAESLLILTP